MQKCNACGFAVIAGRMEWDNGPHFAEARASTDQMFAQTRTNRRVFTPVRAFCTLEIRPLWIRVDCTATSAHVQFHGRPIRGYQTAFLPFFFPFISLAHQHFAFCPIEFQAAVLITRAHWDVVLMFIIQLQITH